MGMLWTLLGASDSGAGEKIQSSLSGVSEFIMGTFKNIMGIVMPIVLSVVLALGVFFSIKLGIAYAKKLGKRFTRDEFTSMLLTSTNDIDQYLKGTKRYYDLSGGGWTDLQLNKYQNKLGTGAVDAWKFLMAIEGTPTALVKANQECSIDLDDYLGEGVAKRFDITIDVDNATKTALGLTTNPVVRNGKLVIRCTKIGSGKITLASSVGKDPEMSNGIGGHGFSKEISITSRLFATENGGWL
jgi:hypothetical protein